MIKLYLICVINFYFIISFFTMNDLIYKIEKQLDTADIITEDLRLIERFLYQFKDIFKR